MSRIICFLTAAATALLCALGCQSGMQTADNPAEGHQTKVEESGSHLYYILSSKGGAPESLSELKANSAQLAVSESEECVASVVVEYDFLSEGELIVETGKGRHTLSLCFPNVACEKDGQALLIEANSISGTCIVDGQAADYTDVSMKGCLGGEDSNLSVEGMINGHPFALEISSATTTRDSFVPEYLDCAIVDFPLYKELEVTNGAGVDVQIRIKKESDEDWATTVKLVPGETRVIADANDFPFGAMVEITYGGGKQLLVSGSEIGKSQSFSRISSESSWYPSPSGTGAIIPFGFSRETYIVNGI